MAMNLAQAWWAIVLRGVAGVVFGVMALFWPPSAFALVDGVFNLVSAVRAPPGQKWGMLVFEGVVGILTGVLTFFWPGLTGLALVLLIAAWSAITGIAEIAAAIRLRKQIQGEWLLGLAGLLSIAFGVLLFIAPAAGAVAIAIWVGAYSIVFGALLIGLGFRLRSWATRQTPSAPVPRPA